MRSLEYKTLFLTLATLAAISTSSIASGAMPEFKDFPAAIVKNVKVDFAGKYNIVTHACGAGCQLNEIVDVKTKQSYQGPASSAGIRFQPNSILLIANPIENFTPGGSLAAFPLSFYYVFEEGKTKILLDNQKIEGVIWMDAQPYVKASSCQSSHQNILPKKFDSTAPSTDKQQLQTSTENMNAIQKQEGDTSTTYIAAQLCKGYQDPERLKQWLGSNGPTKK